MRQLSIPLLFDRALLRDPAGPFLTYYDDASGERTEVSATTLGNWVAKTANFLTDGLGLNGGARIAVLLPPHWQTAGILLGAWSAGHEVLLDFPDSTAAPGPDAMFCTEASLDDFDGVDCEMVGVSLDAWGRAMSGQRPGVTDYAQEIGVHGDHFRASPPVNPAAPALTAGSLTLTQATLAGAAQEFADRAGMSEGDRIMVSRDAAVAAGPLSWLLAPLAAGTSVVLVTDVGSERLPARASAELVTATLGFALPGIPVLGG